MDYDPEVYKTAKSTRPAWANALIVAGCLFLAAIVFTMTNGIGVSWWLFLATGVTLVVAGIYALVKMGR